MVVHRHCDEREFVRLSVVVTAGVNRWSEVAAGVLYWIYPRLLLD